MKKAFFFIFQLILIISTPSEIFAQNSSNADDATLLRARLSCPPGLTRCGDDEQDRNCRDLSADQYNCGRCDNACESGYHCQESSCIYSRSRFGVGLSLDLGIGSLFTDEDYTLNNEGLEMGAGFNIGFGIDVKFSRFIGLDLRLRTNLWGYSDSQYNGTMYELIVSLGPQIYIIEKRRFNLNFSIGLAFYSTGTNIAEYSSNNGLAGTFRLVGNFQIFRNLFLGAFLDSIVGGQGEDLQWLTWGLHGGVVVSYQWRRGDASPVTTIDAIEEDVHVLVVSQLEISSQEADTSQVIETPSYRTARQSIRTVAVVAPDRCADRTLSQATGRGVPSGEVLGTTCGVEMGEIENILAQAGYNVISWRTMQNLQGLPRDRAAQLGADVLFQVNSLEQSENMSGILQAERVFNFYESDEYGTQGRPVALVETDASILEEMLGSIQIDQTTLPGAGLDLQAVDVRTGQVIWAYRWRRLLRTEDGSNTHFLFRGVTEQRLEAVYSLEDATRYARAIQQSDSNYHWERIQPVERVNEESGQLEQGIRSGGRHVRAIQTGVDNQLQTRLFSLLTEIIFDCVERFRCGDDGQCSN